MCFWTSTRFSASRGELPPSFLRWWKVGAGHHKGQNPAVPSHQGAPSIDWVVPHLERISCPSWSLWVWHHLSSWPSISPSSATTDPQPPPPGPLPSVGYPSALTSRFPAPFYLFISLWLCWAFLATQALLSWRAGPSLQWQRRASCCSGCSWWSTSSRALGRQ